MSKKKYDGVWAISACVYDGKATLILKSMGNLKVGDTFYRKGHTWKIIDEKRAVCTKFFPQKDMNNIKKWFNTWKMPDGLPDKAKDIEEVDETGLRRLAEAVYKDNATALMRLYILEKRRIWQRIPEQWSEGSLNRAIKETEYWFYDNPFRPAFTIEPEYLIKKCRLSVFGRKWEEHRYFVKREKERTRKAPR